MAKKPRIRSALRYACLLLALCTLAQARQRIYGYCEVGGQKSVTAGVPSSTFVQASVPGCLVTVTLTGTTTLATLYADNQNTPLSNPFNGDSLTGYWFFYADNGAYDVTLTQNGVTNTLGAVTANDPFVSQPYPTAVARTVTDKLNDTVSVEDFQGADCGAQINNAYQAIAGTKGTIVLHHSCSFSTPVLFNIANTNVTLQGEGNATTMTYTGTGTAISMNDGILFDFSTSLKDITLTGPGHSTGTVGVQMGGSNGCVGCAIEHVKIQAFGTGMQTASNTWLTRVSQSMLRDNGINLLMPSSQTQAGENIAFDHDVFADAPTPHTNSVWVQGTGQEVVFEACSFDQAQLRIGNGSTSAAQVVVSNSHFENPNFSTGVDYDYVVVDNHNGNFLRLADDYMLQDRPTGAAYARYMLLQGGVVQITGLGMFTPAGIALTNLAVLANAVNVNLFGFNDLSGQVGQLYGGATTGYLLSLPGADTGLTTGPNNIIGAGDLVGGSKFQVKGNIGALGGQLVSTITTGTAPLVVDSTTPVNNLFGPILIYSPAGTQQLGTSHAVEQSVIALSGGAATITLTGPAAFSNSSSYVCTANDTTSAAAVKVTYASGSSFTLAGTSGDNATVMCIGN